MTYDALIVGGGPAGCSAALTLRLRGKSVLMITSGKGALEKARQVNNYPGMPEISGEEMVRVMRNQVLSSGAEIKEATVQRVLPAGKTISVLAGNEIFSAWTVLLATGAPRVSLLRGEEALVGQGVSYCATCDGMFYRGKKVAVIGGMEEAAEEAGFLAGLGASVTYYSESPHDLTKMAPEIRISSAVPAGLRRQENDLIVETAAGEEAFAGVFILRPAVAVSLLLPEAETDEGRLKTDKEGRTSLPLIFAAGDAAGAPYQAAKAVGDGNVAALAMAKAIGVLSQASTKEA